MIILILLNNIEKTTFVKYEKIYKLKSQKIYKNQK